MFFISLISCFFVFGFFHFKNLLSKSHDYWRSQARKLNGYTDNLITEKHICVFIKNALTYSHVSREQLLAILQGIS